MFEQFTNSIKATLYDRVSSPLSSSFIISWCLWNYKILIVLFSSMKPYEKYNTIDILVSTTAFKTTFFEPLGFWLANGFLFPLISAVIYIYVYPYPAKYVYKYWLGKQNKLKEEKDSIGKTVLLSLEQSIAIKKNMLEIDVKFDELLSKKDKEIIAKYEEINGLNEVIKNLANSNKTLLEERNSLNTANINMLDEIKNLNNTNQSLLTENQRYKTEIEKRLSDEDITSINNEVHLSLKKKYFRTELAYELFKNMTDGNLVYEHQLFNSIPSDARSKIAFDVAIDDLFKSKLISNTSAGTMTLTPQGKRVALELGLA
ncbi:hypothetical protein [Shewanella sp.]|uniref:hypothetical protein n=1 Tax=Shewanella sp. TaxID=50422 RepID=UPI003A8B2314